MDWPPDDILLEEGWSHHKYNCAFLRRGMWPHNKFKGQMLVFKERLWSVTQDILDKEDSQIHMENSEVIGKRV